MQTGVGYIPEPAVRLGNHASQIVAHGGYGFECAPRRVIQLLEQPNQIGVEMSELLRLRRGPLDRTRLDFRRVVLWLNWVLRGVVPPV